MTLFLRSVAILFAVFGLVACGVGWFLAGDTFKGWFGRARSRS